MRSLLRLSLILLAATLGLALAPGPARAASCNVATSQGSTGPATWETYCWLDFTSYNDTTAKSASGQNFSYALADGSTLSFNMKVTTANPLTSVAAPAWSGAAVGNTAFLGIAGKPVMYQTGSGGNTTISFTGITLTPAPGASASTFMFVAGDGESSNDNESLKFVTNGGNWVLLDTVGPTSGSTYPTQSGAGTQTFTTTGVAGTVGAYIVGSSAPTTVTTTLVGGGLQGAMFAVRFASIRLNMTISATRVDPADQFDFKIAGTNSSTTYASGSSSGTGLGPYTAATLSAMSAFPVTLTQTMKAGSTNAASHYRSLLTCTNAASSSTAMPTNVVTTSYDFGSLQFGDAVSCNYNVTPYPHLTLTKALGTGGRQYASDQFVMDINQGATTVATTTTTGSGTTVTNASTPVTQVTAGTTYVFDESGSGTTLLAQYTSGMACTNAWSSSPTTLPTTVGGSITPQLGDVVRCTITNTKRGLNADLTTTKTSSVVSDPSNGTTNPKAIPGAVVSYSIQVNNTGPGTTTTDSIFILDALPSTISVGTSAAPSFVQGTPASGLTFTAASDVKYSNAGSAPASFSACTYTPTSAYDPAVKYVCINPKGSMSASTGLPPSFTVSFNAQIR